MPRADEQNAPLLQPAAAPANVAAAPAPTMAVDASVPVAVTQAQAAPQSQQAAAPQAFQAQATPQNFQQQARAMPQKTQDAVQPGAPVAYAVQPGAQVAQPGAPSIMIASSGSDAPAEASQQRPRRVSPGVAAAPVCAASQLAAGACLLAISAYHCSPSNPGESGACSFAEFLFGALLLMLGGCATVMLFIAGFGVLVIGSDAAAEASQQRLRRVSRRLAAVCAVSLLVLVVTYLNTKGPIDSGKYD
eukprot:COSAG02_NODE_15822_length_1138_cov_2.167469_2_plen_246_part_01